MLFNKIDLSKYYEDGNYYNNLKIIYIHKLIVI